AGIEYTNGRWLGMKMGELHADAARDHLLFAAGIDEQQVLLTVVEEAEVAGRSLLRWRLGGGDAGRGHPQQGPELGWACRCGDALGGEKGADAFQRFGGDARTVAQAGHELAVVDGAAAKGRFGHAGAAAEFRDAVQ